MEHQLKAKWTLGGKRVFLPRWLHCSPHTQTPECQPSLTNWEIVQRPSTPVWVAILRDNCMPHAGGQGPLGALLPFLMPEGWQAAVGHAHRCLSSWLLADAVRLIAGCLDAFLKQNMYRQPQ